MCLVLARRGTPRSTIPFPARRRPRCCSASARGHSARAAAPRCGRRCHRHRHRQQRRRAASARARLLPVGAPAGRAGRGGAAATWPPAARAVGGRPPAPDAAAGGGVGPPWCGVGTGCQVWAVLLEPEKQPAAQEDAEPVDDHHGDACRARGRPISRGGWGWARRCRRGAVPSIAARSLEAAISWSCERAARAERTRLMPEPTTGGRMEVAMATPTTVSESALVTYYTPT